MTTQPLWLILSSDYVGQELAAEFGRLPPSFLPAGMKRLFEYQLERIGASAEVWITLPESFHPMAGDLSVLNDAGVRVLSLPDGLTLGEAAVYACNLISPGTRPIHLLHGDTLVDVTFDCGCDEVGIADTDDGYSWAEVECDDKHRVVALRTVVAGLSGEREHPVACGYFSFSSAAELVRCLVRARGSFVDGVNLYAQERGLSARRVGSWLDFGHLRTFYRSRRFVTTARAFNSLRITDGTVCKASRSAADKISAEANWYAELPPPLGIFTARLIGTGITEEGVPCYETEYEYLPTLAELFVFGSLDRPSWNNILESCSEFLKVCAAFPTAAASGKDALVALVRRKTIERLECFARESDFPIERELRYQGRVLPALVQIAEEISAWVDESSACPATVMHGDFCFSNILYNSRVRRVRVIDPRGYVVRGQHSVYGDMRYDLAKLAHSIWGRYDHIVAGRYSVAAYGDDYAISFEDALHHPWAENAFQDAVIGDVQADATEIQAITISLFLSMLPLHVDHPRRQQAFVANALRLYSIWATT